MSDVVGDDIERVEFNRYGSSVTVTRISYPTIAIITPALPSQHDASLVRRVTTIS